MVKNLSTPLLGLPAIKALGLLVCVDSIDMGTLKSSYTKLCSGLGMLQQPYTIKLKPDAVPFSVKTPRRISLPLVGPVKEELQRMEALGVISRVEEPTDWCARMVVVPKKDQTKVRLCVDLTGLNMYVCREKYILPSVKQSLDGWSWMPTWALGRSHLQRNQPSTLHLLHRLSGFTLTVYHLASPKHLNISSAGWQRLLRGLKV